MYIVGVCVSLCVAWCLARVTFVRAINTEATVEWKDHLCDSQFEPNMYVQLVKSRENKIAFSMVRFDWCEHCLLWGG